MNKRYDFATKQEVSDLADMVRRFVAEQDAKSERAALDMKERYADVVQIVNEAHRMTNDSVEQMCRDNVRHYGNMFRRIDALEDRTIQGRVRRVRHWLRVRWYRLTLREVDRD